MTYPKRLLISRLSAMGDVAMVVPVIISLNRSYPDVDIFVLSRKKFEPLFNDLPQVTFLEAKVDDVHKGPAGLYRLSKEIMSLKVDAFADFHDVLRTKLVRNLTTGMSISVIDKGRSEKKKLVKNNRFFQPLKHSAQRYLDVLTALGYDLKLEQNEFLQRESISDKVTKHAGIKNSKWIGFAPFAAHKTKSLTVKRAKKILKRITEEFDVKVILIGGGNKEKKKLQLIAGTTSNVFVMAGLFDFKDELRLISNLDAMIAMDSGNGHLSALYNIPTITLWGNTHPFAGFAPYGQPEENQITVNRNQFPLVHYQFLHL